MNFTEDKGQFMILLLQSNQPVFVGRDFDEDVFVSNILRVKQTALDENGLEPLWAAITEI